MMSMEQKCSFRNSSIAARQEAANALELKPPKGLSPQNKPKSCGLLSRILPSELLHSVPRETFSVRKTKKH
jgi:hypothetical protein